MDDSRRSTAEALQPTPALHPSAAADVALPYPSSSLPSTRVHCALGDEGLDGAPLTTSSSPSPMQTRLPHLSTTGVAGGLATLLPSTTAHRFTPIITTTTTSAAVVAGDGGVLATSSSHPLPDKVVEAVSHSGLHEESDFRGDAVHLNADTREYRSRCGRAGSGDRPQPVPAVDAPAAQFSRQLEHQQQQQQQLPPTRQQRQRRSRPSSALHLGRGNEGASASIAVATKPTARASDVVPTRHVQRTLSQQLYQLLRLCFLRRWTWHMLTVFTRVFCGRRRDANDSDIPDEDNERDDDSVAEMGVSGESYSARSFLNGRQFDRRRTHGSRSSSSSSGSDRSVSWGTRHRPAPTRPRSLRVRRRAAEACRTFWFFFCCCCCCCCCCRQAGKRSGGGGTSQCGHGWLRRLQFLARVLWVRYRYLVWGVSLFAMVLLWCVVIPLMKLTLITLLEREDVFVFRMSLLGLPAEVRAPREAAAVFVQLPAPVGAALSTTHQGTGKTAANVVHDALVSHVHQRAEQLVMESVSLDVAQRYLGGFSVPYLRHYQKLRPSQLPAWTLFSILSECAEEEGGGGGSERGECITKPGYAAALQKERAAAAAASVAAAEKATTQQTLSPTGKLTPSSLPLTLHHGVFATSAAPLGRIGPMLLAMASVTDDVDVARELTHWAAWLPTADPYAGIRGGSRRAARAEEGPPRYTAVLGIPSSDHPARAALRAAQRETWMTYTDVATTANRFHGTLLALYVFAAAERTEVLSRPQSQPVRGASTRAHDAAEPSPDAGDAPARGAQWHHSRHPGDGGIPHHDDDDEEGERKRDGHSTRVLSVPAYLSPDTQRLRHDVSILLPTLRDLTRAAQHRVLSSLMNPSGQRVSVSAVEKQRLRQPYTVRRMSLRAVWQSGAPADSPCDAIHAQVRHTVLDDTDVLTRRRGVQHKEQEDDKADGEDAVAILSAALRLPVHPLYTTPAQFICHASAALWQEALVHRDALWLDMMTDRQPTGSQSKKKKLGDTTNWGLPVEVGMSQKLILWLEYAYHAFPDVPFILKGDDDLYLKVPQYVNDVAYLHHGRQKRLLEQLTQADAGNTVPPSLAPIAAAAAAEHGGAPAGQFPAETNYLSVRATEECLYWGSLRRWNAEMYFSAGMLTLLHRRIVQAVLEDVPGYNNDVVRLSLRPYTPFLAHSYYAAMMDHEDVMLGKVLTERRVRALQLCPYRRLWYIWEPFNRFHDVHRGRQRNVTWSTVSVHRCTPADMYYLHFYFHEEYKYGGEGGAKAGDDEQEGGGGTAVGAAAEVQLRARQWLAEQQMKRFGMLLDAQLTATTSPQPPPPSQRNNSIHGEVRERQHQQQQQQQQHTRHAGDVDARTPSRGSAPARAADWRWAALPELLWTIPPAMNHTPLPYVRSLRDGVAVYEVEYEAFSDGYLVLDGFVANPKKRSS